MERDADRVDVACAELLSHEAKDLSVYPHHLVAAGRVFDPRLALRV
jgi:hypothetical protein